MITTDALKYLPQTGLDRRGWSAVRRQNVNPDHAGMPPVVVCGSAANRSTCCGAQRRAGFVWRGMELSPILVAGENRYARKPGIR